MAGRFGQWGGNGLQSQQGNYGGYTPPTSGAAPALPAMMGGPSGTGDTGTGVVPSDPNPLAGPGSSSDKSSAPWMGGPVPLAPGAGSGYGSKQGGGVAGQGGGPVMFMDDGGVVPTDDESNDSATIDPMQALVLGRQKMGLPASFYGQENQAQTPPVDPGQMGTSPAPQTAPQPGMFDGGVVPDQPDIPQNATPGTGAALPDPRQAMSYLAGAGGVSPDIANALERANDPTGQLSPAERTMATVQNAGSPEAAFQLMQHYRTKFNAYSGAARAALDKGDLGQAAAHATAAMANVPTGYKVEFAPARGGLAMMSQKIGQKNQQGMDDGGQIQDHMPTTSSQARKIQPNQTDEANTPHFDFLHPDTGQDENGNPKPIFPWTTGSRIASAEGEDVPSADNGGVIPPDVSAGDNAGSASDEDTPPVADVSPGAANDVVNTLGIPAEAAPTIMPPEHVKSILAKGFDYAMEKLGNVTDWLNGAFPDRLGQEDARQAAMEPQGAQNSTGAPPAGNASTTVEQVGANIGKSIRAGAEAVGQGMHQEIDPYVNAAKTISTGAAALGKGFVSGLGGSAPSNSAGEMSPNVQSGSMLDKLKGSWAQGEPAIAAAVNADQPQGGAAPGKDQSQVPGGKSDQGQTNRGVDPQTAMRQATQMVDQAQPDLRFASQSKARGALILEVAQKLISGQQQLAYASALGSNKVGLEQMKEGAAAARTVSINQRDIEIANIRAGTMLQNAKDRDAVNFWGKVGAAMPGSTPEQITTRAQAEGLKMGFTPLQMKTAQRIYEQEPQQPDQVNGGQSQANRQIPLGHINYLKTNPTPDNISWFERTYGQGAAQQYLNQGQ